VRDGILDNHRLNSFGMSQGHTKADRAAVVLHEQGVAIQIQLLRKVLHEAAERKKPDRDQTRGGVLGGGKAR